jgi:hypothetical protein
MMNNTQTEYDDWLAREIQASIADKRPALPLSELEKLWEKERAELLEKVRKVA